MLQPNTVVLTVNTRQYEVSDDGDDIEPDEAKYPFLKWFTGDVRARYRMCHCGSGGSSGQLKSTWSFTSQSVDMQQQHD